MNQPMKVAKVPCFSCSSVGWIRGRRFVLGRWYPTASPCPKCEGRGVVSIHPVGELCGTAKLTWEIVRAIRAERTAAGLFHRELAEKYGISAATVKNILAGKS